MKVAQPPNLYMTKAQIDALEPAAFEYYRQWISGLNYDYLQPYEQDQLVITAGYVNQRRSRELQPGFEVTIRDGQRVTPASVPWWFYGIGATLAVIIVANLFAKPK